MDLYRDGWMDCYRDEGVDPYRDGESWRVHSIQGSISIGWISRYGRMDLYRDGSL